ncbi:MAG: OmpA family protein, partial [Gammaproteobacteria bacterium]|nr:OmpA family protein [Gammaproteobacteria bacterium]
LLVCVIRGVPPKRLRADLSAILERIHFRYGDAIRDYKGDTSSVPDVEVELERCLRFEAREEAEAPRSGLPRWMLLLLLLLIAAGAFFAIRGWQYSQQLERLTAALGSTPGIHVTSSQRDGGHFAIGGLRDPLAASVASVAESVEIPADRISASLQPFQSLEPEIVLRRAEQLQAGYTRLPGVDALDVSGLDVADQNTLADRIRELSGKRFFFLGGVDFVPGARESLQAYVDTLRQLQSEAQQAGASLRVTLTGSTDAVGDAVANVRLAERRAAAAAAVFADAGVDAEVARLSVIPRTSSETQEDANKRHVQVDLELQPTPQAQ